MASRQELAYVERHLAGQRVRERAADKYYDATAMCAAAGKLFADWKRLDATGLLLAALSADMGIPITELIQSLRGGNKQGTWVHPKVAIALAMWCSPEFHVRVLNWVYDGTVDASRIETSDRLVRLEKLVAGLISDPRYVQTELYKPMIDILRDRGIGEKGRRGRANKCANYLVRWKEATGREHFQKRDIRNRRIFHVDEIEPWLRETKIKWGGDGLIKQFLADDAEDKARAAAATPGKNIQQVLTLFEGGKRA